MGKSFNFQSFPIRFGSMQSTCLPFGSRHAAQVDQMLISSWQCKWNTQHAFVHVASHVTNEKWMYVLRKNEENVKNEMKTYFHAHQYSAM